MPEEIFNPLESYRDRYRDEFREAAREEFQRLREAAQVDEEANQASMAQLRKEQSRLDSAHSRRCTFLAISVVFIFLIVVGFGAGVMGCNGNDLNGNSLNPGTRACFLGIGFGGGLLFLLLEIFWILPALSHAKNLIAELQQKVQELTETTWAQMAPLNQRYDWDIFARLIRKVCPMLNFDPYFTSGRLQELQDHFEWDSAFAEEPTRSVLVSQSGDILGNPFVFARFLEQDWGTKTYYGHKTIHWRERVPDADGKGSHWETRTEVLTASYTAPIPTYNYRTLLIYGNDAAPKLTFSRTPNTLSQADDGFFSNLRKKRELKKLKAFAENLDDESQYTMMSNEEFELLFHATDRSDEIQFRLLYTPLAMSQTVSLLKDNKVGFGDDFSFYKCGRCNLVAPRHLVDAELDTNPAGFATNDMAEAEKIFLKRTLGFFRDVYFSLAPLLCIPLYQQTRSARTIYGFQPGEDSCFWEHESLANYAGAERFAHPKSVTHDILKARRVRKQGSASEIQVDAHGFQGIDRVEHVTVYGGDGDFHDVAVPWIEYLPVERTSSFSLREQIPQDANDEVQPLQGNQRTNLDDFLDKCGLSRAAAAFRRSIFAWNLPEK